MLCVFNRLTHAVGVVHILCTDNILRCYTNHPHEMVNDGVLYK